MKKKFKGYICDNTLEIILKINKNTVYMKILELKKKTINIPIHNKW